MHIIGRGRYARETYPERFSTIQVPPAFAFDQNVTPWAAISEGLTQLIGSASITVRDGSRILIRMTSSGIGSVAAGFVFLHADTIAWPEFTTIIAEQSFNTADGTNHRNMAWSGVSDQKTAGTYTFQALVDVNGVFNAKFDGAGVTLTLEEIPAP